jgi:PKD repeat protein
VGWGTTFSVETPDAADIAKVSLIRLGSVTHAFDMNQRLLWLAFTRQADALTLTAPASGSHAPPGHYMLFLVNQNGVPSVGKIVKVGAQSEPSPGPNSAPIASFLAGCGGLNCNFADKSTDPDGNLASWQWTFGDGATSAARDPSHAYQAGGTYIVRLTTRDTEGESATLTRQVTVPGPAYPLGLSLTTSSTSTQHKVVLTWTRAQGTSVYIYRNGLVLQSTPNDGQQTITRNATGAATYIFKVCEAATTICSNAATAQFGGGSPTENAPPNAAFTPTCDAGSCRFADGSTDTDGSVSSWRWEFGDGTSSTQRNPSHTFPSAGTYQVRLTVTDDRGAEGTATKDLSVEAPLPGSNISPVAAFSSSCTNLSCSFTDQSTDQDGSVQQWSWSFGDGATSTVQHPSRTYSAAGSYTVTLTVTDDGGATSQHSASVSVTAPPPPPPSSITLTISGRTDVQKHYITHLWSGATGASVDLYRNGRLIQTTPNDGRHTTAHRFKGTATWRVKVCQVGSTTVCSPERSITLSN